MLQKNEQLFNVILGTWKIDQEILCWNKILNLYVQENIQYQIHIRKFIERGRIRVSTGITENSNESQWRDPYFTQIKLKTIWVNVLKDFRNLNS